MLSRYYAGLLSEKDKSRADQIIESSLEERRFRSAFATQVTQGGEEPTEQEINIGLSVLWSRISGDSDESGVGASRNENSVQRIFRAGIWKYALAASFLVIGWFGAKQTFQSEISSSSSIYSTAPGQRANIVLPDGSIVDLNVGSSLQVPSDYATGNRFIKLNGEARFTVRHHNSQPFVVAAGEDRIEVLGTVFAVKRYNSDSVTSVAVQDGKVRVSSTILTRNQSARVYSDDGGVTVGEADPSQFSFASGIMVLKDVALVDAIPELNRWYDADIVLDTDNLKSRRITGKFSSGSITDLIEILELTYQVRVDREDRTITLSAQR